jgi:hypothetical protein
VSLIQRESILFQDLVRLVEPELTKPFRSEDAADCIGMSSLLIIQDVAVQQN